MSNNSKRRGMHPLITFMLGFLLALIIFVGAIAGIVMYVINYKLDDIEANKEVDSDGNTIYKFINADPDNGGAETVMDLITKLIELTSDEKLTLAKMELLLPVTSIISDGLGGAFEEYLGVEVNDMRDVVLTELGDYLQDKMMDVRPAKLLSSIGGTVDDNPIIDIVLNGKEADYVENGEEKYPVYYDIYNLVDGEYVRDIGDNKSYENEVFAFNGEWEPLLSQNGESYRLYYFHYRSANYITVRGEDGKFSFMTDYNYSNCVSELSHLTGNYYYGANGELVEVSPITLGSFADGSAFDALYDIRIIDLLEEDSANEELTQKILGGMTLGELMDGSVDFKEIMNGLEVISVMDVNPDNNIMMYLAYGVKGVFDDGRGNYACEYTLEDGTTVRCEIVTEEGEKGLVVTDVYYNGENGEQIKVPPTLVGEIGDRLENITYELALSDLIKINEPDDTNNNSIMYFLAYSVTDVVKADGEDYSYKGIYHLENGDSVPCYLVARGGEIVSVYYYEEGEMKSVKRTVIAQTSSQISRLKSTLKISDMVTIAKDNRLLKAVADSTIDGLPDAINNISVNEIYADSIYSPKADGEEGAKPYLAVSESEIVQATEYNPDYIYYTLSGGKYVLASTTGKLLSEEEYNGFEKQLYTAGEGKILFDKSYVYYVEIDGKTVLADEGFGRGKVNTFAEGVYYTYGCPNALWKILLCTDDGEGNRNEIVYSVNNMTQMIKNVTANTHTTSMFELNEAGIIKMEYSDLIKPVDANGTRVGDLTLSQVLSLFLTMLGS